MRSSIMLLLGALLLIGAVVGAEITPGPNEGYLWLGIVGGFILWVGAVSDE